MVSMPFPFYRVASALCAKTSKAQPFAIMWKTNKLWPEHDYSDIRTIARLWIHHQAILEVRSKRLGYMRSMQVQAKGAWITYSKILKQTI